MALAVQGVANLTVEGLRIEQAGGDGIYLGQVRNFNISIRQVTIWKAFRNGLTVGNIEGVRVEDTVIGMTNGTAPMAGVDFESDMCFASLRGVFFRNVSLLRNSGSGFQFTLGPSPDCHPWGGQTPVTADFEDITVAGSGTYGFSASANGPFPPGGHLNIRGLRVSDTVSSGLLVEDKGDGWPFLIQDAVFVNVSSAPCPYAECPNGPLWIEGRNEQCSEVTLSNVTLEDDRPRWPVSFMGSLSSTIGGELVVRNPAGCVAHAVPNVSLVVNCSE